MYILGWLEFIGDSVDRGKCHFSSPQQIYMWLSDIHNKSSQSFNWILIESDLAWSQLFAEVYLSTQRLKNYDKVTWSCKMAEIWQTSLIALE